jgi:hypothetical protein
MNKSIVKRVKLLEDKLNISRKRRTALVIYDPDLCPQSEIPPIDADIVCLPDNGFRMQDDPPISKGSYTVFYS